MRMSRYLFLLIACFMLFCQCRESDKDILDRAGATVSKDLKNVSFMLDSIRNPEKLPPKYFAEYNYLKAICLLYLENDWAAADSLNSQALAFYEKSDDTLAIDKSLLLSTHIFVRTGIADSIISRAKRGVEFERTHELRRMLPTYYNVIVSAYWNKSDFENALLYSQKLLNEIPDSQSSKFSLLKNHALILEKLSRPNEAFSFFETALNLAKIQGSSRDVGFLYQDIAEFCMRQRNYKDALLYINESIENRVNRKDATSFSLTKGLLFKSMQENDSALVYFQKTVDSSSDTYITLRAYKELSNLYDHTGESEQAYYSGINYSQQFSALSNRIDSESLTQKYNEVVLENENNQLKLAKNRRETYILLSTTLFIAIVFVLVFILFRYRKTKEIKEKEQANLLLKQENELALLREKTATLRESLFRKMSVSQKIPSLDNGTGMTDTEVNQRIRMSEKDWDELIQTTDNLFSGFVKKLEKNYELTHDDIRFCCLIKIKVSMQDLADIYCISKAGITKRKTRMKKEKFHITDESVSLDGFLMSIDACPS